MYEIQKTDFVMSFSGSDIQEIKKNILPYVNKDKQKWTATSFIMVEFQNNKIMMTATDTYRLSHVILDKQTKNAQGEEVSGKILLSPDTFKKVSATGVVIVIVQEDSLAKEHIIYKKKDVKTENLEETRQKKIDFTFPNYKELIPKKYKQINLTNQSREELEKHVKIASKVNEEQEVLIKSNPENTEQILVNAEVYNGEYKGVIDNPVTFFPEFEFLVNGEWFANMLEKRISNELLIENNKLYMKSLKREFILMAVYQD